MDAEATTDEAWHDAYGEVVWPGRRCAGVKFSRSKLLGGDGGTKAGHRGKIKVSRKAIGQGRPECSRRPVCSCARSYAQIAHETAGAASTRSSLRPLIPKRANEDANLGRNAPRECETISETISSAAKQSISPHKERMDCFAALAMTWIVRSPDERSDIRDHSNTAPDIASLIR